MKVNGAVVKRTPYFTEISNWLEPIYLNERFTHLSLLNHGFIQAACQYLGIKTSISNSWHYSLLEGKTKRLADLCRQAGGAEYIYGWQPSYDGCEGFKHGLAEAAAWFAQPGDLGSYKMDIYNL